jgi:hypothetical protein
METHAARAHSCAGVTGYERAICDCDALGVETSVLCASDIQKRSKHENGTHAEAEEAIEQRAVQYGKRKMEGKRERKRTRDALGKRPGIMCTTVLTGRAEHAVWVLSLMGG